MLKVWNGYMTECQINLSLIGKKSTERPLFWPWSSAASFKKKNRLNRNLIFFSFFRQTRLPYFPQGHCSEQDQSAIQWLLTLKTWSNDSTHSTLDQPLWNLLKSDNVQLLPTHSHPILLFWPVSPAAGGSDCCSVQMLIKHHCRNAERLGGLAKYADEVLHKNPITDWTQ